jgi:hypothetical protein
MRFSWFAVVTRALFPSALVAALTFPAVAFAQASPTQPADQDHIVSSQALQQQVETSSATRQKNIDAINQLLAMPQVQRAMRDRHIDAEQVRSAVPTLSNAELANLGARATHVQEQFAAGAINHTEFLLAVLVIVLLIIILIIH